MAEERLKNDIAELIERPLIDESAELVEVVLARYKANVTVRLFVYSKFGTTIDECARLSRIVGDLLDGTDWFPNGYTLEISSPGLNRALTQARDFRYRTGETIRVEFADVSRKKLTAEILSANDDDVQLKEGAEVVTVPLSDIKQARIVF